MELTSLLLAGFAPLGVPARPRHALVAAAPLVIAHRGGSSHAPENTMVAFTQAVEVWAADMIELDVRASADGRCVVIHDATVDRTTDGTGPVAAMTLDRLRALDAGHRFGERASFPFRGRGVTIPTIDEVFEALPTTPLTIEVKEAAAQQPLFDAIERFGATDRVVIAGMYDRDRTMFSQYRGAVSASSEQFAAFFRAWSMKLGRFWRLDADVVQIPEFAGRRRLVTQRLVRQLHGQGVPVHVWTINQESDMQRLLDWSVDGIVTDRLDTLVRVLHRYVDRPLPAGAERADRNA